MIFTLIYILFAAFAQACFTDFLLFCIDEGNIFEAYGRWVRAKDRPKIYKALGGCGNCSGFWLALAIFWLWHISPLALPLWSWPVYVAMSNYFLNKVQ